jgi:hypothetical protein
MTPEEVHAYKMADLYQEEFLKIFKGNIHGVDYRRNTLPSKKDPRKSVLFKHCWKMLRETRGLLKPEQNSLYIRANLTILKMNNSENISPNCICGEKAWIRWKVWERWFNRKLDEIASKTPVLDNTDPKLFHEIDKTKKFLFERCDGEPSLEKIKEFLDTKIFKMWLVSGKVSRYYVALSPYMSKLMSDKDLTAMCDSCFFDLNLIKEKITEGLRSYFKKEFSHEEF